MAEESRTEKFRKAFVTFQRCPDKTPEDYLAFLQVGVMVTRQGSGLCWSDIEKIIKEEHISKFF